MVMIDDATGRTLARFFEAETTHAAMTIFRRWAGAYGLPEQVYPDRHSIYRVNTQGAEEQEARTGKRPLTQFGRALAELGVRLTCAKSPQAKGRVERMNGTCQDRLVKLMRLEGIATIPAANAYLEKTFLPQLNARFAVAPASPIDGHRRVSLAELDLALGIKEERAVGRDHCVSWQGQVLQLEPGDALPSLAGKQVTLRQDLDGQVRVWWRERRVEWREARPAAKARGSTPVAGPAGGRADRPHQAPSHAPLAGLGAHLAAAAAGWG